MTQDNPKPTETKPKPGNVFVRYIGRKSNFTSFKRPRLKEPVVFKNNITEVSSALGQALVKTYPKTFKYLTAPEVKTVKLPEV